MSVVITGNPGVGKHTIAKKLAETMNFKILDINKIALESGLYEKKDGVLEVNTTKLKPILTKKITKKSLIVGHLAPFVVPKSKVKLAIVLRKNPYKLLTVYKKRKYSRKKIADNVGSEVLGIIAYDSIKKFGKSKTCQIDTTSISISNLTKKIKSIFKGKFDDDKVDWLSLVSEKNNLKKFFPY